jgi:hypothetical protein
MTWALAINVSQSTILDHYLSLDSQGLLIFTYFQAGGSPDRIGGSWQLRRISSVVVNGDTKNMQTLYQHDTHKSIILSTPLKLKLPYGTNNTITVGGLSNGFDVKGADLEKIIVYPPE